MTPEQFGQFVARINDAKTWRDLEAIIRDDLGELTRVDTQRFLENPESDDQPTNDDYDRSELYRLAYAKQERLQPKDGEKYIFRKSKKIKGQPLSGDGSIAPEDGEVVMVKNLTGPGYNDDPSPYCHVVSEDGSRFLGGVHFKQLYPIPEKDTTT